MTAAVVAAMDTMNIPHGAVTAVTYYSTALKKFRRMHVYTPPGYESGKGKYPVFYLLHGAGDCDEAWTSVGRAGFILDKFGYIGVYSSGIFGIMGGGRGGASTTAPGPTWAEQHQEALANAKLKPGLRLFWFATGKDDFLIETSRGTVGMFKKHGFNPVFHETSGGHTWIKRRHYLNEFAPQLFQ